MSDIEEEESINRTIKITVLGEPNTGKSSLCHRYLGNNGAGVPGGSTQGAEVLAGQCLGVRPAIPLQLCDVAGNSLSTCMLGNYLYNSDIVMFVYDLTNLQSFEKLKAWRETVKNIFDQESKKPLMALFGNKSDLEHQRAVRFSCVKKFASEYLLENFIGSAKTGDMVNHVFTSLIARVLGFDIQERLPVKLNAKVICKETRKSSVVPDNMDGVQTSPLIMNRKTLRKIQRKASSSVCCVQ